MQKIYTPETELDLSLVRSLLEAEGLDYYVHNDHFGSLTLGPAIHLFNAKTIFVADNDRERAEMIIADYLRIQGRKEENPGRKKTAYSFRDRLRVMCEVLLFGWFIPPGNRSSNEEKRA